MSETAGLFVRCSDLSGIHCGGTIFQRKPGGEMASAIADLTGNDQGGTVGVHAPVCP